MSSLHHPPNHLAKNKITDLKQKKTVGLNLLAPPSGPYTAAKSRHGLTNLLKAISPLEGSGKPPSHRGGRGKKLAEPETKFV